MSEISSDKKRRTLEAAVKGILEACPERLRPDRHDLIKALKQDKLHFKQRWPDAVTAKILGSTEGMLTEHRRLWPEVNRVMMDAVTNADW